jgi:hypothetical protein
MKGLLMRFPRVRFTVRRMMVAVAVVGILTWCGIGLYRRWSRIPEYRARARNHADALRAHVIAVRERSHTASPAELVELNRQRNAYHTALKREYERAASFPWKWMPPDPPDPVSSSDFTTGRRVDLNYGR